MVAQSNIGNCKYTGQRRTLREHDSSVESRLQQNLVQIKRTYIPQLRCIL